MLRRMKGLGRLLVALALLVAVPVAEAGKGYSSGSRSYSSSSSRSSSGGSSRSSGFGGGGSSPSRSSGSSSSSGSGGKSYSSGGGGKSYSSGGNGNSSYSSGRSYSGSSSSATPPPKSSGMSLDNGASRAAKEQASKDSYNSYKRSQNPSANTASANNGGTPPIINRTTTSGSSSGGYSRGGSSTVYNHTTVYVDHTIYSTRPYRLRTFYAPYYSRPIIVYHDHYNSFFWWWLLDRSIEDQAYWAYHHRQDMDSARYQALLDNNAELANRVHQLETNQVPRDPNYVPAGVDPDLMYNDQTIKRAYAAQPTRSNTTAFWVFTVPALIGITWFMGWLVFYKRWQTA